MKKAGLFIATMALVASLSVLCIFAMNFGAKEDRNISETTRCKEDSRSQVATMHDVATISKDEYVDYSTKGSIAKTLYTNKGDLKAYIYSKAKVAVDKSTGNVKRVIDFGVPYASISSYSTEWRGGEFNVNRVDDTSARFSTTGQFIIHDPGFSVGYSIVSVKPDVGAITETMTLATKIKW